MRRAAALAGFLALALAAVSSDAAYHIAAIDEVMSGVGADPSAQYLEIRMFLAAQGITSNVRVAAWNCMGAMPALLATIPSDLAGCSSVAGGKWSVGTASWAALHPGTPPDFSMTAGIPPTCGTVCWGAPPDMAGHPQASFDATNPNCYIGCLVYGGATPPPNPTACAPNPAVTFETTALGAGNGTMSTQRSGSTFVLATPTPENAMCSTTTTSTTTTTTSSTTTTTPPPLSKCTSAKFKASGKKASDKAVCHAKAVSKGLLMVDSTCLAKTEVKFSTAFAKAEAKAAPGECLTTGDTTGREGDVDAFISQLSTDLGGPGPSKCSSNKYKAAGKKAKGKLDCHAKALAKGVVADSTCLAKTEVKFSSTVAKTESKAPPGECLTTGDASTVETHVDSFVDDIHTGLVP